MSQSRDPLAGFRPIGSPSELREPTLAAARRVLACGRQTSDLWTRVARSRALRVAWAIGVLALLLAHVALSVPDRRLALPAEITPRIASGTEPELLEIVRMPAIDPAVQFPSAFRKENGS